MCSGNWPKCVLTSLVSLASDITLTAFMAKVSPSLLRMAHPLTHSTHNRHTHPADSNNTTTNDEDHAFLAVRVSLTIRQAFICMKHLSTWWKLQLRVSPKWFPSGAFMKRRKKESVNSTCKSFLTRVGWFFDGRVSLIWLFRCSAGRNERASKANNSILWN